MVPNLLTALTDGWTGRAAGINMHLVMASIRRLLKSFDYLMRLLWMPQGIKITCVNDLLSRYHELLLHAKNKKKTRQQLVVTRQ